MRPACGPEGTMRRPPGIVEHMLSASACGSLIASTGGPNVFPPSVEVLTQIWLGPQSWYERPTSACFVVLPGGIHASVHCRSTSIGWFDAFCSCAQPLASCGHVVPLSKDFHIETCREFGVVGPRLITFRSVS